MSRRWIEPLHWENAGSEPSEYLKQNGFMAGDKPPADLFNYFLHTGEQCIKELQREKIDISNATIDRSASYQKSVGVNPAKHAKIKEIGGITRKCTNLWKPFGGSANGVYVDCELYDYVQLHGTCTESTNLLSKIKLYAGTYCLSAARDYSGFPSDSNSRVDIVGDGFVASIPNNAPNDYVATFTIEEEEEVTCRIRVQQGHEYNLCKLYPMLSRDEALPYERYFEGLQKSPVTEIKSVGTNLFDVSKIPTRDNIANNGDGSISVTGYGISTGKTLKQLCPSLEVGDTATLKMVTDGMQFIYLSQWDNVWDVGGTIDIAGTHLNSTVYLYCKNQNGVYSKATISDIVVTVSRTGSGVVNREDMVCADRNTKYTPYLKATTYLPEDWLFLDGYGEGINSDYCNKIVFGNDNNFIKFRKYVERTELSTYQWNLNTEGTTHWWSATLNNCKSPSVNTEMGCFLAANYNPRTAAGMSASVAGEIALDVGGVIRVNTGSNTEQPQGELLYILKSPVEQDLQTEFWPYDNSIEVSSNGLITMVNARKYDVPSVIELYYDNHGILAAYNFVGNLIGIAKLAEKSKEALKSLYAYSAEEAASVNMLKVTKKGDDLVIPTTGVYIVYLTDGSSNYTSIIIVDSVTHPSCNGTVYLSNYYPSVALNSQGKAIVISNHSTINAEYALKLGDI